MTPTDAVKLARYVKALCPHQKIDEYTADVWHDVIGDLDLDDCRAAVKAIVTSGNPFVGVAEIITEVRRIRAQRLANSDLAIPPVDPADEADYRAALRHIARQLGNGQMPFRAIEGGRGAEPSEEFRARRDDLKERRQEAALAAARDLDPIGLRAQPCACGALLDPDGSCLNCRTQAGAS